MAKEIVMPRQGNTVESCVILEWKKNEGDNLSEGDVICEVETDKATFEVETPDAGIFLKMLFEEGADVPVLTPIAVVGQKGEDVSSFKPGLAQDTAETPGGEAKGPRTATVDAGSKQPDLTAPIDAGVENSIQAGEKIAISPRARKLADRNSFDYRGLRGIGTGPGGRIIERDINAALSSSEPLTPSAAAVRAGTGLAAPQRGTGIGGRVRVEDLVRSEPTGANFSGALEFPGTFGETAVKGVRKLVGERMHASLQSTAQLTMHTSADARQILGYRKKLKASPGELGLQGITINDLVLYATVRTLARFPALNAHFLGDKILTFKHIHAAFAVDTPRGLMVPVVRFAETLSLKALAEETKRLSTACLAGNINPDELSGGSITVTNLGILGIEMFTPVLNAPQVSILGVCSIQPKPVMNGDVVDYVPHIGLSLTIDHQAVDGAPAARFLKELADAVAGFDLVLAG